MRAVAPLLILGLVLAGCGARQVSEGGDSVLDDEAADPLPEWSPCAMKGEVETCAELCAAQGTTCVANGCPADLEFCDPEPCDMATQVLALDAAALCADPSVGSFVASTCGAPIDWLFSNTLRCCCAE